MKSLRRSGRLPLFSYMRICSRLQGRNAFTAVSGCLVIIKILHLPYLFFPFFYERRHVAAYSFDFKKNFFCLRKAEVIPNGNFKKLVFLAVAAL
jgi:hypothetical protein